jgi:hypothetical protein
MYCLFMPKKVPGQMGPYFSLSNKNTTSDALDAILEKDGADNLVEELHRKLRKRDISNMENPIDVRTVVLHGKQSILNGLREAIRTGIADNYTFHFAATALAYAMELEKLNSGFFDSYDSYRSKHDYESELESYINNLVSKT